MRCPATRFDGTVESFSPASGSVFSLLPPENATGNFTKIVQRLPVRIEVPAERRRAGLLRPGMSVVVSVDTKPGARRQHARSRRAATTPRARSPATRVPWLRRRPHLPTRIRRRSRPRTRDRSAPADRLPRHGVRHVHGDPRHPDRLGLADRDPGRPRRQPNEISWVQTAYLIAEVIDDPALGLPVARARHAHPVRGLRRGLHFASLMCGLSTSINEMIVWRACRASSAAA